MICEHCGLDKEDTELRINPYQHDMNDNEEEEAICLDCYQDLLGDI